MEFDCIYGDLELTVTLKATKNSYYSKLSQAELMILSQWIYLACNCFMTTEQLRMLDSLDRTKPKDIKEKLGDDDDNLPNN